MCVCEGGGGSVRPSIPLVAQQGGGICKLTLRILFPKLQRFSNWLYTIVSRRTGLREKLNCKSVANIAFQRAKVRFNSIRKFLGKYRIDVFAVSLL